MGNSALISRFGAFRGLTALAIGMMVLFTAACGNISDRFKVPTAATVVVATDGTDSTDGSDDDGACATASDCNDKDKATVDTCVDGECVFKSIECNDGFELNELGECTKVQTSCPSVEDTDLCTIDSCNPATGEVLHVVKSCDDEDSKTVDACDSKTGDCLHNTDCGNCADDDACTLDTCDVKTGECVHDTVVCPEPGFMCQAGVCKKFCTADSDCGDENWCTLDSCNMEFGECQNTPRNCKDMDETTIDHCEQTGDNTGICHNVATGCTGGCSDGNDCTDDTCQAGKCLHKAMSCYTGTICDPDLGGCVLDLECLTDAKCDDGNACTLDECEGGVCQHVVKICGANEACDAKTGECLKLDLCPQGCDDGNKCTTDTCVEGKCANVAPNCLAGTLLNPTSCGCETAKSDPDCVDGTISCQQSSFTGMLVYAICANGAWFTVENCGKIASAVCIPGVGCGTAASGGQQSGGGSSSGNGGGSGQQPANIVKIQAPAGTMIRCWGQAPANLLTTVTSTGAVFTCPTGSLAATTESMPTGGACSCWNGDFSLGMCHTLVPGPGFGCQL